MNNEVIAFDLDGVLSNFIRGFTRIGNRLFGTPVCDVPAQVVWMFEDFPTLKLDKTKCDEIWKEIKGNRGFWANLDPCNVSAMYTLDRIVNKVFITNRPGLLAKEQTESFLERWGVIEPKVILAVDKGPVAKDEHILAAVDDYHPNCRDMKLACPDAYVAMLATPYNAVWRNWKSEPDPQPEWPGEVIMTPPEWTGPVVLSVDHFIAECDKRKLVHWAGDAPWQHGVLYETTDATDLVELNTQLQELSW
jgi:hypothetical protein